MATILPTGETTFFDDNGDPLSEGSVYFYVPGTFTPKDTWNDPDQDPGNLNTNPVVLDAAGRAIIYGSGSYRQIVKDADGNTIWDQLTADTAQGGIIFGGVSAGTPNAQTLDANGFNETDGQILDFIAGETNTSQLTMTIGTGSPIPVLKDSSSGPTPLTGGEVVTDNVYQLFYELARGAFHVLNPTDVASNNYVVATGTGDAMVATIAPAITSYSDGLLLEVMVPSTNTGAATIDVSSLGPQAILTGEGAPLVAGQLVTGQVAVLIYDGANFQLVNPSSTLSGYTYLGVQTFTGSGTYTPSAGCAYIEVEGVGAGGGGGAASSGNTDSSGAASGGSSGAFGVYRSSSPSSQTVTIGAAGAGSTNTGNAGTAGGSTSFGALLVLGGGPGGLSMPSGNDNRAANAPAVATASAGTRTSSGNPGGTGSAGSVTAASKTAAGGNGAGSPYGGGGRGGGGINTGNSSNGSAASGYGAGGGGAGAINSNTTTFNGAAGTAGLILIREYAVAL